MLLKEGLKLCFLVFYTIRSCSCSHTDAYTKCYGVKECKLVEKSHGLLVESMQG
jgi:hypothetical protein